MEFQFKGRHSFSFATLTSLHSHVAALGSSLQIRRSRAGGTWIRLCAVWVAWDSRMKGRGRRSGSHGCAIVIITARAAVKNVIRGEQNDTCHRRHVRHCEKRCGAPPYSTSVQSAKGSEGNGWQSAKGSGVQSAKGSPGNGGAVRKGNPGKGCSHCMSTQ